MAIIDDLKNAELFGGLGNSYIEKLLPLCRGGSYRQGTIIFKEGSEAAELYILTEGKVAVEMELCPVPNRPTIPTPVDIVTKGQCIGWSALVEPHIYTLSARCMTNCTALSIKGDMLRKVMNEDTGLGYEVMKQLSKIIASRLMDTRLRLTSGIGLVLLGKQLGVSD